MRASHCFSSLLKLWWVYMLIVFRECVLTWECVCACVLPLVSPLPAMQPAALRILWKELPESASPIVPRGNRQGLFLYTETCASLICYKEFISPHSPHRRSRCRRSQTQASSGWLQEPSRETCPPPSCGWYGRGTWMPQNHKSEIPSERESSEGTTKWPMYPNRREMTNSSITNLQHFVCCHYHWKRENRDQSKAAGH